MTSLFDVLFYFIIIFFNIQFFCTKRLAHAAAEGPDHIFPALAARL